MAWLSGWTSRAQITIAHTDDGAQTNYQMPVKVYRSTGTDGSEIINGQPGGKVYVSTDCQADYDDIRFTKSDGETVLDCWLETYDANSGTFNVEFDSIPAHPDDGTFYMYYGNASATAVSNGANTFITFDDFERGVNGDAVGGSWTASGVTISTDHAVSGTRCAKIAGSAASYNNMQIAKTAGTDYAIRYRYWKEDASKTYFFLHGNGTYAPQCYIDTSENFYYWNTAGVFTDTTKNSDKDKWQLTEFKQFDFTNATFDWTVDGVSILDDGEMNTQASFGNIILIQDDNSGVGNDLYIDDFIVRKWTANEPTFGTWGNHESVSSVGGAIGITGTLSETATAVQDVGQGAVTIIGAAIETSRTILQNVGDGMVAITGSISEKLTALANVGQGAIAIAGSLGSHIIRRLYATVGGAYRTFLEVTKSYRRFKKSGDYRRFKE